MGDLTRQLKKSKLGGTFEKIQEPEMRDPIVREYAGLLAKSDLSNRMLRRHLTSSILPAIAVYRVLTDHGWERPKAMRLIRASVLEAARPMARAFQRMGKLPFFFLMLRRMCPLSMKSGFGEAGWTMDWKRNDRKVIAWNCTRCFYADVFQEYGVPELTPIFCESDDVVYGRIPGVRWGRTRTIGRGAEFCDFVFYNVKAQNGKGMSCNEQ